MTWEVSTLLRRGREIPGFGGWVGKISLLRTWVKRRGRPMRLMPTKIEESCRLLLHVLGCYVHYATLRTYITMDV